MPRRSTRETSWLSYEDTHNHPNNGSNNGLTGLKGGKPTSQKLLKGPSLILDDNDMQTAGIGLFCGRKPIKDGALIGHFKGKKLHSKHEVQHAAMRSNYVVGMIDAADPNSCIERYGNDAFNDDWYNMKIKVEPDVNQYEVNATKNIQPWDEIFTDMGTHWNAKKLAETPQIKKQYIKLCQSRSIKQEDLKLFSLYTGLDYEAYWDSGASLTATSVLSALIEVQEIQPFVIGGIDGGIVATHKGRLPWLPADINKCYYAKELKVTLITLGYCNSKGYDYCCAGRRRPNEQCTMSLWKTPGVIVATSVMSRNMLFPVILSRINLNTQINAYLPTYSSSNIETMRSTISQLHTARSRAKGRNSIAKKSKGTQLGRSVVYEVDQSDTPSELPSISHTAIEELPSIKPTAIEELPSISHTAIDLGTVDTHLTAPSFEEINSNVSIDTLHAHECIVRPISRKVVINKSVLDASNSVHRSKRALEQCVVPKVPDITPDDNVSVFSDDDINDHTNSNSGNHTEWDATDGTSVGKQNANSTNKTNISVTGHLTKEVLIRADEAEELHVCYCHPSDSVLGKSLDNNLVPGSRLTSRDIRNNRHIRGRCPQCDAGKNKRKPMKTSITPPATEIGDTLCIDIEILREPTPNGSKQQITCICEKSGRIDIVGSKSKSEYDMFIGVWQVVGIYNRLGFKNRVINVDIERGLVVLQKRLAIAGISIIPAPAEQHQQRCERYIQTINERTTAILAGLTFILPVKYLLQVKSNVALQMNKLVNSKSDPSTPYLLTEQKHPSSTINMSLLRVGATAMIRMGSAKRDAQSKITNYSVKNIPKTELGVCLGEYYIYPGQLMFAIANGHVVPRKTFTRVNVHPFDWKINKPTCSLRILQPKTPIEIDEELPAEVNSILQIKEKKKKTSDSSTDASSVCNKHQSNGIFELDNLEQNLNSDETNSDNVEQSAVPDSQLIELDKLKRKDVPISLTKITKEDSIATMKGKRHKAGINSKYNESTDSNYNIISHPFMCVAICDPLILNSTEMSIKKDSKHPPVTTAQLIKTVAHEMNKCINTYPTIRK